MSNGMHTFQYEVSIKGIDKPVLLRCRAATSAHAMHMMRTIILGHYDTISISLMSIDGIPIEF